MLCSMESHQQIVFAIMDSFQILILHQAQVKHHNRDNYFDYTYIKDCHSSCKTCINSLGTGCLSCLSNAYINGTAPSNCLCGNGFYPNPDASSCSSNHHFR